MGNLALVNFPDRTLREEKIEFAKSLIDKNRNVKTVLEKSGKFRGRLRKQETKFLAGINTKEVLYRENGCVFRFNIDETYFSSRLSNERKEIAEMIKKGDEVLVMFAGVAPFPIVIAKNSEAKMVYSNEINRKANYYAKENIARNKLKEKVELLPGDIKKVALRLANKKIKFEDIIMPRPQLKDSFLHEAFMLSKKGTRIVYYDFCKSEEITSKLKMIEEKAKENKKRIKIKKIKNAGELSPSKRRIRIDFEVKN
jgi:tRNA (guanine37-N1)-methyltransferase